jgi:hypothetical protein
MPTSSLKQQQIIAVKNAVPQGRRILLYLNDSG